MNKHTFTFNWDSIDPQMLLVLKLTNRKTMVPVRFGDRLVITMNYEKQKVTMEITAEVREAAGRILAGFLKSSPRHQEASSTKLV